MEIEPHKKTYTKTQKLKSIREIKLNSKEIYETWLKETNYLNYKTKKPFYCPIFPMINCES